MRTTIILILITLIAPAVGLSETTYDPPAIVKTIAPFVEEQTLVVVRIDFSRLDVEATWARFQELFDATKDHDVKDLVAAKGEVKRWTKDFIEAGGRDLFFVFSLADLPANPYFVVVPLQPGAKVDVLSELVTTGKVEPANTQPVKQRRRGGPFGCRAAGKIKNVIVAGSTEKLELLRAAKGVDRPELSKAFAAAGDSFVQIAVLPTADSRRVIEDMMPELPKVIGGGPSTVLTRGLTWAAIGVNAPPKMSVRLVVQSKDEESAKAFGDLVPKIVKALVCEPLGFSTTRQDQLPKIKELTLMLTPKIEGNRLKLTLNHEQTNTLINDLLAPPLRKARIKARRTTAMLNAREICKAVYIYEANHNGQWPANFQVLVEKKLLPAKMLVNPRLPNRKVGYVYIKPPVPFRKLKKLQETILIYEVHDKWGEGICVGFADGHVQFISHEARFKKLLGNSLAQKAPDASEPKGK